LRALTNTLPAIQPSLLNQQAATLAENFSDPDTFVRSLHYLLEFYSDRSRNPGIAGSAPPITSAYKVRMPVIKTILRTLEPLALKDPQQALNLCDVLWNEPVLEFRQLGAMLLGQIPPEPPELIIERLKSWLQPELEFFLIETLMQYSFVAVRKRHPQAIIRLVQDWIEIQSPFENQIALRALLPLISNPDFQNVPVFYRLIQPLVISLPTGLRPDVVDVLEALARRSPQETAFFLRSSIAMPNSEDAAWLTRQLISDFPPELQKELRLAVREVAERKRSS